MKMATKRYKRPSSARRNIKQEEFSVFTSLCRLRRIQSVLQDENETGNDPDALLCIAGIDGRYNEGTAELIDYLLFGFFSLRKNEIERSGFEEETVDDLVFLIRKRSVDVYCNPINYMYILPYVANWRNLHIHCLTDQDYEDTEKAEEFKITSLVNMTQNCRKIGIPYSCMAQKSNFDIMLLEKWPLIQAFALEGVGGGGFFTLKYDVTDMSEVVHPIYRQLEPVSLEAIVTEKLSMFERQWDTILSIIDVNKDEKLQDLKATTLSEPIKSYFSHGTVSKSDVTQRPHHGRQPFLLLGSDTTGKALRSGNTDGRSSTGSFSELGSDSGLAKHMIFQAVAPKTSLACRRTYFFTTGVLPYPMFNPAGDATKLPKRNDAMVLIQVYTACMEALHVAINIFAMTRSLEEAEAAARETLLDAWESAGIPVSSNHITNRNNFEFTLEAMGSNNQNLPVNDVQSHFLVKTATISVMDLPSLEHPGSYAGSVSFGESFMESILNVEHTDGRLEADSEVTILTSNVPRFISWAASPEENLANQHIFRTVTSGQPVEHLGELLIDGHETHLVREGDRHLTIPDGNLYMYEQGIVYTHAHHGTLVLPKPEMAALHFYDGDSPSVLALLAVSFKENMKEYLPLHLRCSCNRLVFAFMPKSKAYRLMFTKVLPVWKDKDEEPTLQRIEEIPSEFEEMHKELQREYDYLNSPKIGNASQLKKAAQRVEGLQRFIPHFEGSTALAEETVNRKHMSVVAGREYDPGSFGLEDKLIVSIIGGLPGSGKTALGQYLSKYSKDEQNWAVIKQAVTSAEGFSAQNLQLTLAHTWQAIRKRRRSSARGCKLIRVLVITPGYTDTVDVIQAISSIPDKDVARHVSIGAVTVCIDQENAFMCDRYALPKLLDQCAQGWVNNIVFTSPTGQTDKLDLLQTTVRALNSDVALLIAPTGEVTRSTDVDLLLSCTAFDDVAHIRARCLSCPGWWKGTYNSGSVFPAIEETVLRFSRPLDKNRFTQSLKGLKSKLSNFPFHGNIYNVRGKVVFEGSSQVFELRFTVLSGKMVLTEGELKPAEQAAMLQNGTGPSGAVGQYCVVFSGVRLEERVLKEWLQGCAKQKPNKKEIRTKASLTKAEKIKIHKERHLEPLPEGWFYNGAKFVSLAGDKEDFHPNMDVFIEDFIVKTNKDSEAYNAKIDREESHELF